MTQQSQGLSDEAAVERYRYLLRTAPPDAIEQAHVEAFERLTPDQRREVLQALSQQVSPAERPGNDDPQTLARAATRAEMRHPGTLERAFGGMGGGGMMGAGMGMGSMFLTLIAGSFVGTAIAQSLFGGDGSFADGYAAGNADSADQGGADDAGGDTDAGGDFGGGESSAGDFGGQSTGDTGTDFGGGDFGGGDFGGGDFGGGDFGGI